MEPVYKVLKDRVIELTYNSFDYDSGNKYLAKYFSNCMGGCSAVKVFLNDKVYVGRNYDFFCSNTPAVIVRNNSLKYKTIGICNFPSFFVFWSDNFQIKSDVLKFAPFLCCDVMSEAGIYAEVNIRRYHKDLVFQNGTETEIGQKICALSLMQIMLSQYSSIDEIVSHLDDYGWQGLPAANFELAFLFVDSNGESGVLEFVDGVWHFSKSNCSANFYIYDKFYKKDKLGCGELRLSKELAYMPFVRNEKDIFTMMKKGAYSQFYTRDVDPAYAAPEFYKKTGYDKITQKDNPYGCYLETKKIIDKVSRYNWEKLISEKCMETVFSVATNVTDRYMCVNFSEHYGINFVVSF